MPPVRLQLLGQVRLIYGETVIERFRSRKTILLLAYLALHPGNHSRADLASRLWTEKRRQIDSGAERECDKWSARNNLSQELHLLKQDLKPLGADNPLNLLISVSRETLGIQNSLTTDVGDFYQCLERAADASSRDQRIALYQQAIERYGGEFLPAIPETVVSDGTLEYWLHTERENLADRYEEARRTLSQLRNHQASDAEPRDTVRADDLPDFSALSEPEQSCLRALTLFPGGCMPRQADRVFDVHRAADRLEKLTAKGWVRVEGEGKTRRFYLVEAAQEEAAQRLSRKERRSLQARLLRYYRGLLYEWDRKYVHHSRPLPEEARREMPNMLALLDVCFNDPKLVGLGMHLSAQVPKLQYCYPKDRDALSDIERALEHASQAPQSLYQRLLFVGGHLALARGKIRQAKEYFQREAEYERAKYYSRDPMHLPDTMCLYALCCHHLEEDAEAICNLEEALTLYAERRARPDMIAAALAHYATALETQGRIEDARRALEDALARMAGREPLSVYATTLYQYGCLLHHMGEMTCAAQSLNESWNLREQMGDFVGMAECLRSLGILRAQQGAFAEARSLLKTALTVEPESGNPMGRVATRGMLGWVAFLEGSLPEAEKALTESLQHWQAEGHQRWQGVMTVRLAAVALVQGKWRQSRALCREAIRLCPGRRALLIQASALCTQGRTALWARNCADAEQCLSKSLTLYRSMAHPSGIAECLEEMGLMARLMGREADRERWEAEALALREALGVPVPPVWRAWRERLLSRHA